MKRILSVLTAAALSLTLSAYRPAEFEIGEGAPLEDFAPLADASTPTSGTCGEAAAWSFDAGSGLLSISGQGKIYDYDYDNAEYAPWYAFREQINRIFIASGITKIGNNAFRGLLKATGADIPVGVVEIGHNAFTNCNVLADVVLPDGISFIGRDVFSSTDYFRKLRSTDGYYITPNGYLLKYENISEHASLPKNVCLIASQAFYYPYWTKLYSAEINSDCIICDEAFIFCYDMQTLVINGNCTITGAMVKYGEGLKSITVNGDCTITGGGVVADWCNILDTVTINGRLTTSGSFAVSCPLLTKITYTSERSNPSIADNTTGKFNNASTITRSVSCLPADSNLSTCSNRTEYNNGFGYFIPRRCAQEIEAPDGTVYVACGVKDVMQIVSPNSVAPILEIKKQGFDFAAACIDEEYNWYIMWSYKISNDIAQGHLEDENIVIAKYTFDGRPVAECRMKVKDTSAPLPLDFGSASMAVKDNILGVFYNTVWLNGHQGAEFAAINKTTMKLVSFSDHQGSHAFGTMLIPTRYGFAGAHLGDAFPRGIAFHSYYVSGTDFRITSNGPVLVHSNGSDTDTHTHWGGFAVGPTSYAAVGKSERFYTSGSYEEYKAAHPSEADVFDVFVRIADQTLLYAGDIGGENRIDAATGEIADTNVFWLTSCSANEKAGQVKVAALENGAYCVLWEKFLGGSFDSVRYVIMNERGDILRHETQILGARLSNTSIQPIAQGNVLTWATADAQAGTVTWYSVDLEDLHSTLPGDLNRSGGSPDVADGVIMQKILAHIETEIPDADLNNDGRIDVSDGVEMQKILAHIK